MANITGLSHELLCQILKYLPLREILSVAMLSKKMSVAVVMHLRLCKSIDFCQDAVCGYMPSSITDDHLLTLLRKCPHLETVYGLHPAKIERRRLRKRSALTISGIVEALSICSNLKAVETSDLRLLESIIQHLPHLEIIGHFQNRDGVFPPRASQRLKLQPYPRISSLHLIGVEVPELTAMPHLQHLHLQCVRFTKLQPFRAFLAQNLKSFVMKHCIGPAVPQRYLSLIIALSSSPNLNHLELVRVPLLNGLFQRAVEDSYRHNGFVNLKTLVIANCKGILEADLGHLMIVASKNLETLYIQPSLTRDSLFVSLSFANCSFPRLHNLHLGYVDNLSGDWSNDTLLSFGLAEIPDTPSSITDSGMKVVSQLFPHIKTLSVSNCPHLMVMYQWMPEEGLEPWSQLTDLTLQKCHCLQLPSFVIFVSALPSIQVIILNDMFREPPKGCSHVGLSAGTGLGMSSAVVSNQDEHIAVQGPQQDFEHPGDEENEENERDFDLDPDENPEPHFMVLQRDFFDGEEDDGAERNVDNQAIEAENAEGILEQPPDEGHLNADLPDYYVPINEHSANKINNNNNPPNCSLYANNDKGSPRSPASSNQIRVEDKSKCSLKTNRKSSKSVHVSEASSDLKDRGDTLKSGESCVEDVKGYSFLPKDEDTYYIPEYDPHKPSTSKAGRHLDYTAASSIKTSNSSDSETDSDCYHNSSINNKRMKKFSGKQNFSREVKKPKMSDCTGDNLPAGNQTSKGEDGDGQIQNEKVTDISAPSSTDSLNYSNSLNSFSCKKYDLIDPSDVPLKKLENETDFKFDHCKPDEKLKIGAIESNKESKTLLKQSNSQEKNHFNNNIKSISSNYSNLSIKTENPENLEVFDPNQPSTSKAGINVNYKHSSNNEYYIDNNSEPDLKPSLTLNNVPCDYDYYYVFLPNDSDGPVVINNHATNKSFIIPDCYVIIDQINGKNSDELIQKPDAKTNFKSCNSSLELDSEQSEYNPHLPSTSRVNNIDFSSNTPSHYTGRLKNKYSKRQKIKTSRKGKYTKHFTTLPKKSEIKRLKISNADAAILCKKPFDRSLRSTLYLKEKDEADISCYSANHYSDCPGNSAFISKNCNPSVSEANATCSKLRKKKNYKTLKKKILKNNLLKAQPSRKLRNSYKNTQSLSTVSQISRGTQATSADIRRSVRRIRRTTAHARKTAASSHVSKSSAHSSKISSKIQNKKATNSNSRLETHDKATSTSDPLLEDDAVQVLRLTSNSLLSFTVVSCGISDLEIEHCPKLFHVEVQACRIFKKLELNDCPVMKRLNISQCPKLNISALVTPVMSLTTDSYFVVSFEPCMQGYHPSEGEKAIFSKAALNQSVLLCHDFNNLSHDGMQAKFRENLLEWLHFLSKLYEDLKCTLSISVGKKQNSEIFESSQYPWSHDLRKKHGQYTNLSTSSDFCHTKGRYELITNNPIFCDLFEASHCKTGFFSISDCDIHGAPSEIIHSLFSLEALEKFLQMQKNFLGFYIPITESNQINFYK